jgi:hypothetical protein
MSFEWYLRCDLRMLVHVSRKTFTCQDIPQLPHTAPYTFQALNESSLNQLR